MTWARRRRLDDDVMRRFCVCGGLRSLRSLRLPWIEIFFDANKSTKKDGRKEKLPSWYKLKPKNPGRAREGREESNYNKTIVGNARTTLNTNIKVPNKPARKTVSNQNDVSIHSSCTGKQDDEDHDEQVDQDQLELLDKSSYNSTVPKWNQLNWILWFLPWTWNDVAEYWKVVSDRWTIEEKRKKSPNTHSQWTSGYFVATFRLCGPSQWPNNINNKTTPGTST